jgi:hypothetical protein
VDKRSEDDVLALEVLRQMQTPPGCVMSCGIITPPDWMKQQDKRSSGAAAWRRVILPAELNREELWRVRSSVSGQKQSHTTVERKDHHNGAEGQQRVEKDFFSYFEELWH